MGVGNNHGQEQTYLTGNILQVDETTVSCTLDHGTDRLGNVIVSSNVPISANPTALIPAFLPIAARLGYDLHIEGSVDERAAANSVAAIDTLASWDNTLRRARLIDLITDTQEPLNIGNVACLASLGLDSFYSIHTRRDDITHLVVARGFDISLNNDTLWNQTIETCRIVAAAESKELIEVTTNVRELADPHLSWTKQFHGAAIASFTHLLDRHVSRLIISSSFTDDTSMQWGSHSKLDPLWSSSRLEFEHYGLGVDRVEKMRAVADNPSAMSYMRVCVENLAVYNCGRCEKCVRTMCNAAAADVGDKLQTLPPVTPGDIINMPLRRPTAVQYHLENLRHLQELSPEKRRPDLESAIEARLQAYVRNK